MFKDLSEKEYIMEDLWNLDFTIQYRNFAGDILYIMMMDFAVNDV